MADLTGHAAGCLGEKLVPCWWRTAAQITAEVEAHGSIAAASRAHGVKSSTVRAGWGSLGLPALPRSRAKVKLAPQEKPGVVIRGDDAIVTSDLTTKEELGDIDGLLRRRGLNPADWIVKSATVNEWEGPSQDGTKTYRQLKIHITKKLAYPVVACAALPPKMPKPETMVKVSEPRLVALFGCAQAPYHDEQLHALTLRWLAHNKPAEWDDLGDLADFSTISKHRDNPAFSASTQECVNAGFRILNDRVQVLPEARRRLLKGNHDDRVRTEVLNRAERMHGLRAGWEERENPPKYDQLSLYHLWHLERLGVEYIEPERDGDYEQALIELSPEVEARHGHLIGPDTLPKMLRIVGRSVAVAHTHKQRIYEETFYHGDKITRLSGMEIGLLGDPRGGFGYAMNPPWNQGFGTVTIWPSGEHVMELARYHDGVLSWRDQRWVA